MVPNPPKQHLPQTLGPLHNRPSPLQRHLPPTANWYGLQTRRLVLEVSGQCCGLLFLFGHRYKLLDTNNR